MDKEEIKSRIISIKDCNGIKCCADEESVKAVMPQIYAAFRELHNKKINLFTPASTRKRFTSKKNLKSVFYIFIRVVKNKFISILIIIFYGEISCLE